MDEIRQAVEASVKSAVDAAATQFRATAEGGGVGVTFVVVVPIIVFNGNSFSRAVQKTAIDEG